MGRNFNVVTRKYIERDGKIDLSTYYDGIGSEFTGSSGKHYTVVERKNAAGVMLKGLVDDDGNVAIPPNYVLIFNLRLRETTKGVQRPKNTDWLLVDTEDEQRLLVSLCDGHLMTEPIQAEWFALEFTSYGLIAFREGEKWGLYSLEEHRVAIPPRFDREPGSNYTPFAEVVENGKHGRISDRTGKYLIPPRYFGFACGAGPIIGGFCATPIPVCEGNLYDDGRRTYRWPEEIPEGWTKDEPCRQDFYLEDGTFLCSIETPAEITIDDRKFNRDYREFTEFRGLHFKYGVPEDAKIIVGETHKGSIRAEFEFRDDGTIYLSRYERASEADEYQLVEHRFLAHYNP